MAGRDRSRQQAVLGNRASKFRSSENSLRTLHMAKKKYNLALRRKERIEERKGADYMGL